LAAYYLRVGLWLPGAAMIRGVDAIMQTGLPLSKYYLQISLPCKRKYFK
jgi:hypothetical protein